MTDVPYKYTPAGSSDDFLPQTFVRHDHCSPTCFPMSESSNRITRPTDPDGLVLEAWGQGLMVGSLVVMAAVTFSNMKRHILLHKLIFAEVSIRLIIYSRGSDIDATIVLIAHPRHPAWDMDLLQRAGLWLASLR